MKKILFSLILAVSIVSCTDDNDQFHELVGTWKLDSGSVLKKHDLASYNQDDRVIYHSYDLLTTSYAFDYEVSSDLVSEFTLDGDAKDKILHTSYTYIIEKKDGITYLYHYSVEDKELLRTYTRVE